MSARPWQQDLNSRPIDLLGRHLADRVGGEVVDVASDHIPPSNSPTVAQIAFQGSELALLDDRLAQAPSEAAVVVRASLPTPVAAGPDHPEYQGSAVLLDTLVHHVTLAGRMVDAAGFGFSRRTIPEHDAGVVIGAPVSAPRLTPAPAEFRALAIICAYNEADVIGPCIEGLLEEGVEVHLMDNWSTDGTADIAERWLGAGVVAIERYPAHGPADEFDLVATMRRQAEIAAASGADWCIHHDADERRRSPWPGVTLRDALHHVDKRGFNAVDHTSLEFRPVDNEFRPGDDFVARLPSYEVPTTPRWIPRVNTWRNDGREVDLETTGGHDVAFSGRRVFPLNFVYQHYPIRSQSHGERKVLDERLPRYAESGKTRGFHRHYQDVRKGHDFLYDPATLERFEHREFVRRRLIEATTDLWPLDEAATRARIRKARFVSVLRDKGLLAPALRARNAIRRR